jgi:nitrogen regulatory protein PII
MSLLAHIGRGLDKQVITAIVAAGMGKKVLEKFGEAPGVLSISHHHARGVGSKKLKTGQLFFNEMDVLLILVEADKADQIFADVFTAADIGRPGGGMVFVEPVMRGHPMLPLGGADW